MARWTADLRGIGPIRFGTSLDEVNRILTDTIHAAFADFERCDIVWPTRTPDVALMVTRTADGAPVVVARVDIEVDSIRTASGIGVGSTPEEIQRAYPNVQVRSNENSPLAGARFFIVSGGDSARMVFEVGDGRVYAWRAGVGAAVDFAEGCA